MVYETYRRGGQDRLLYWPLTSSLDHSTLCYLQETLSTSSASQPGLLNRRPGMDHGTPQVRTQWLQAGFDSAFTGSNSLNWRPPNWRQQPLARRSHWQQTGSHSGLHCSNLLNCRRQQHILFHNAHLLPIRTHDLLPLIYTGVSLIDGSVKGQYVTQFKGIKFN